MRLHNVRGPSEFQGQPVTSLSHGNFARPGKLEHCRDRDGGRLEAWLVRRLGSQSLQVLAKEASYVKSSHGRIAYVASAGTAGIPCLQV